jgi:hypothetical protein
MSGSQSLVLRWVGLVLRFFGAGGDEDGDAVDDGVGAGAGGADQLRPAEAQSTQAGGTGQLVEYGRVKRGGGAGWHEGWLLGCCGWGCYRS